MIPSLFGSKKVDRSPVFLEDDIRKLIISFPPPEPRPGKECLVRSLSGRNFIRSNTVVKRFNLLLETATGFVYLDSLPNELGVHDVQWILTQEDERIHYTRDRRKLLPETIQKQIYHQVQDGLIKGGVELSKSATGRDITFATLRRIITAQDADLALEELENGKTYDSRYLEGLQKELLEKMQSTQTAIVLSDMFPQVPVEWLEPTCRELVGADSNGIHGQVEKGAFGLRFTPQTLLVQQEDQLKQDQDTYVRKAVDGLIEQGYCEVTADARPPILRQVDGANLVRAIKDAFKQSNSDTTLVELFAETGKSESSFLIAEDTLSTRTSSLASRAKDIATEQWRNRQPGEDIIYSPSSLLTSSTTSTPDLDETILSSDKDSDQQIQTSFEHTLQDLQQETTLLLATTIQKELLAPLRLYTQGLETITDPTLQQRVQDFLFDWARKDLIPTLLATLKDHNLIPSKPASREIEKFSNATTSAKSLEDITTATTKLSRKLKIEQPSPSLLQTQKLAMLEQKVAAMKRMKRSSDLLQNVCWVLLAGRREGLFVGAGKDTSRFIKMVKEGDGTMGTVLEGWRDVVKKGEDGEKERVEMREAAVKAVEDFKARRPEDGTEKAEAEVEKGTT